MWIKHATSGYWVLDIEMCLWTLKEEGAVRFKKSGIWYITSVRCMTR